MNTEPIILDNRQVTMQRLADGVRHGYSHYTSGRVHCTRVANFFRKMSKMYCVDDDRHTKLREKQRGLGCASILLSSHRQDDTIDYWLLVTPADKGFHPAHRFEKLKDALHANSRIVIDGFELVRQPSKATAEQLAKIRWTWRMNEQTYEGWRSSILTAIRQRWPRHRTLDLMNTLYYTSPGFAGVRRQVGKLAALYRAEWKRRRGSEEMVPLPTRLAYVRRLPNTGARLKSAAKEWANAEVTNRQGSISYGSELQ